MKQSQYETTENQRRQVICQYIIRLTEDNRMRMELQTRDKWHKATTRDTFEPEGNLTSEAREAFIMQFLSERIRTYMEVAQVMRTYHF